MSRFNYYIFGNEQEWELSAGIDAVTTTLPVVSMSPIDSYQGQTEPQAYPDNAKIVYLATLDDGTNKEIVRIDNYDAVGLTLTVTRNFEPVGPSSTAQSFASGTKVEIRATAKAMQSFLQNMYLETDPDTTHTGFSATYVSGGANSTTIDSTVDGDNAVGIRGTVKDNCVVINATATAIDQILIGTQAACYEYDPIYIGYGNSYNESDVGFGGNVYIGSYMSGYGDGQTAIGAYTYLENDSYGLTVVGNSAGGDTGAAVVIGYNSYAVGEGSVAVGADCYPEARSVAVGSNTYAGDDSAALNGSAFTKTGSAAVGLNSTTQIADTGSIGQLITAQPYNPVLEANKLGRYASAQVALHFDSLMLGADAPDAITVGNTYGIGSIATSSGYQWVLVMANYAAYYTITTAVGYTAPANPATDDYFAARNIERAWWAKIDALSTATASATIAMPTGCIFVPSQFGIAIEKEIAGGTAASDGTWTLTDNSANTLASGSIPTSKGVYLYTLTQPADLSGCTNFNFAVNKETGARIYGRGFILGYTIPLLEDVYA